MNTGPDGTGKARSNQRLQLWKVDTGAAGAGRHGRESLRRLASKEASQINGGLIAESKGHFDSTGYERRLKHRVEG